VIDSDGIPVAGEAVRLERHESREADHGACADHLSIVELNERYRAGSDACPRPAFPSDLPIGAGPYD
jgi:hypothetical protein